MNNNAKANGTVSSELWWAVAAKRIMDDLCDRSGIGDVLCEIDEETFAEIIQDVGDIIMRAHAGPCGS